MSLHTGSECARRVIRFLFKPSWSQCNLPHLEGTFYTEAKRSYFVHSWVSFYEGEKANAWTSHQSQGISSHSLIMTPRGSLLTHTHTYILYKHAYPYVIWLCKHSCGAQLAYEAKLAAKWFGATLTNEGLYVVSHTLFTWTIIMCLLLWPEFAVFDDTEWMWSCTIVTPFKNIWYAGSRKMIIFTLFICVALPIVWCERPERWDWAT